MYVFAKVNWISMHEQKYNTQFRKRCPSNVNKNVRTLEQIKQKIIKIWRRKHCALLEDRNNHPQEGTVFMSGRPRHRPHPLLTALISTNFSPHGLLKWHPSPHSTIPACVSRAYLPPTPESSGSFAASPSVPKSQSHWQVRLLVSDQPCHFPQTWGQLVPCGPLHSPKAKFPRCCLPGSH